MVQKCDVYDYSNTKEERKGVGNALSTPFSWRVARSYYVIPPWHKCNQNNLVESLHNLPARMVQNRKKRCPSIMARGLLRTPFITRLCVCYASISGSALRLRIVVSRGRDASLAAIGKSFLPKEIHVTGDRKRHAFFQTKLASSSSKYN